jgi:hypothetical protein
MFTRASMKLMCTRANINVIAEGKCHVPARNQIPVAQSSN